MIDAEEIGKRLAAAGVKGTQRRWSLDTSPASGEALRAARAWAADPATPGLLLAGRAGSGKTGLSVGILREFVLRGLGSGARWEYLTCDRVVLGAERGGERRRPAPAQYAWWPFLVRAFADAAAERDGGGGYTDLVREYEAHVRLLVLDDFDLPAATSFREELSVWLLDEFVDGGKGLIVTVNRADPEDLLAAVGERAADRLFGRMFTRVQLEEGSKR